MNVPQQQQTINLEQQPLEVLYKLFRQRINIAEQFQRDLDQVDLLTDVKNTDM